MVFNQLTGYATSLARTSRPRSYDCEHVLPPFDCARFAQTTIYRPARRTSLGLMPATRCMQRAR